MFLCFIFEFYFCTHFLLVLSCCFASLFSNLDLLRLLASIVVFMCLFCSPTALADFIYFKKNLTVFFLPLFLYAFLIILIFKQIFVFVNSTVHYEFDFNCTFPLYHYMWFEVTKKNFNVDVVALVQFVLFHYLTVQFI